MLKSTTHDSLCRFYKKKAADDDYEDCEYCELIAKVDARARAVAR